MELLDLYINSNRAAKPCAIKSLRIYLPISVFIGSSECAKQRQLYREGELASNSWQLKRFILYGKLEGLRPIAWLKTGRLGLESITRRGSIHDSFLSAPIKTKIRKGILSLQLTVKNRCTIVTPVRILHNTTIKTIVLLWSIYFCSNDRNLYSISSFLRIFI